MTSELILPLLITTIVAIGGWYIVHRLSVSRDLSNKRRELRIQYLIDAYRRLEFASNRPITPETAPEFEKAIADIQLFGTARQVELAREFAVGMARENTNTLDPVLENITFLRMTFDKEKVGVDGA